MNTSTSTSALLAAECRKDYVHYRHLANLFSPRSQDRNFFNKKAWLQRKKFRDWSAVLVKQSKFISSCKNYGFDVIEVGDTKYDIFKGNKFIATAFYDAHTNRVWDSYNCVHHLNDYVSKINSEYN
ncbi:hypothetical protein [Xenorhabdus bovienii]|uniref:hypothetical protein n=1 Tax=Xenorhabdus bovienii TaxID=40576 RepID=UPI0004D557C6|nr:hypothetical protein [Xenorhabdus bovienii]CDG90091.1 hypothetical protein XBFFR1_580006 [Xenorhabdus bovienii str. feltiae France]CDG91392.1 hypothetical protein XBFFL1_1580007 [Xenorhabdus bovienii str. feltiae Florida]